MKLNLSLECAVEQASELSIEDFRRKYFLTQKPVLLKGLAKLQPAGKKWTIEWFKETMGDIEVDVFDFSKKKHAYSTTVNPDFKLSFGEYLDKIASNKPNPIRMFRYNLYKKNKALRKDFSCPEYINKGPLKKLGFMFLGGKDDDVRLHYDVDNSNVLLTQIQGSKRVVLFAPDQGKYLYRVPFTTISLADLKVVDFDKWPGLKYAKGYEIIQEAGDCIFMPSGYWHYNTYLEPGISVAFRKLAHSPRGLFRGISTFVFRMSFDKIMSKVYGERWLKRKEKRCLHAVAKTIEGKFH